MNIRDLKYLVSVADLKSFTQAACKCHVSQPTLSGQIKKIEDSLQVRIFERDKKTVKLTPTGKDIIAAARRALAEIDDIYKIGQATQDPLSGTIKIGAFPTLASYLFPQIVPALHEQYPQLRLILIEEKTDHLIEQLKDGEIDTAFLALPVPDPALESLPLFDDEFYIAAAPGHALSCHALVDPADLSDHRLLLLEEGHCLRDQALDICHRYDIAEEPDFRATSLETLRQMVKTGTGITLMPRIAMTERDDDIRYIPLTSPAPYRKIGLVWRKTSPRKQAFEKIAEITKNRSSDASFFV